MTRTERISTNPNHFVGNHPLIQSEQLEQYYSEPEDGRPVFSSPFYEVSFHKGTVHWQPCPFSRKILERVIRQISAAELPGSEQVIGYAQDQYRRNCKAATIRSAATAICLFLVFLKQRGIGQLEDIRRPHIGAFIEHEQDRGLKIASVRQKLQQMFKKYLHKAGLADKGYTLHCLRHTCATELLNAGMRIECLQQLLGHSKLEVTRIYARLTDKTREQEYFKAMAIIEAGGIDGSDRCDHIDYRRFLKRKNYSAHTVKNIINRLKQFVVWLPVPLEQTGYEHIKRYIEMLMNKRRSPVTVNCHLASIRGFFDYLYDEGQLGLANPVKKGCGLRVSHPLPRYLKDEQLDKLFALIRRPRDRAMFMLMLRCGLRVEEVARLTTEAVDLGSHRIRVESGKGSKDRIVYISHDATEALSRYLRIRCALRCRSLFVVEKGPCRGKPLSVRGIQKRMEYYARKAKVAASCHHLRHTMATQMLNADAPLVSIQDLLGHNWIMTTQRYCKLSNVKVQRDYHQAMERIVSRYQEQETS